MLHCVGVINSEVNSSPFEQRSFKAEISDTTSRVFGDQFRVFLLNVIVLFELVMKNLITYSAEEILSPLSVLKVNL